MNIDIEVVGKILMNFDRTAGMFGSLLTTKVFALIIKADVIEIIQDEFEEKKDLPGFKELWAEKTGGDNDDEKDE